MSDKSFEEVIKSFPCAEQLSNIQRCAEIIINAAGQTIPQYTYAANGKLYAAEEISSGWSLREETDIHSSVRDMAAMLGDSPISRTDLFLTLTPSDAACFLALLDCYSLAALQAAAQAPITSAPTVEQIAAMLKQPRKGGLLALLYTICRGISSDAEVALKSLADKGVCRFDNSEYLLNADAAQLANAIAMPTASVLFCMWANQVGASVHAPSFAVQGTLHDILCVTVSREEITISTLSADALLDVIEANLSCPEISTESETPKIQQQQAQTTPIQQAQNLPQQQAQTTPIQQAQATPIQQAQTTPQQQAQTTPQQQAQKIPQQQAQTTPIQQAQNIPQQQAQTTPQQQAQNGTCPVCRAIISQNARFCPKCGHKVEAAKTEARGKTAWRCACGNQNKGMFCSKCGAKAP